MLLGFGVGKDLGVRLQQLKLLFGGSRQGFRPSSEFRTKGLSVFKIFLRNHVVQPLEVAAHVAKQTLVDQKESLPCRPIPKTPSHSMLRGGCHQFLSKALEKLLVVWGRTTHF